MSSIVLLYFALLFAEYVFFFEFLDGNGNARLPGVIKVQCAFQLILSIDTANTNLHDKRCMYYKCSFKCIFSYAVHLDTY